MTNPCHSLEKIYHEPNRLAIMSELCGTDSGLTFTELKARCELTDGNLSRHLGTLQKALAIRIEKSFVDSKPRTTVFVSAKGRKSFLKYLQALENVLHEAARRVQPDKRRDTSLASLLEPSKS